MTFSFVMVFRPLFKKVVSRIWYVRSLAIICGGLEAGEADTPLKPNKQQCAMSNNDWKGTFSVCGNRRDTQFSRTICNVGRQHRSSRVYMSSLCRSTHPHSLGVHTLARHMPGYVPDMRPAGVSCISPYPRISKVQAVLDNV